MGVIDICTPPVSTTVGMYHVISSVGGWHVERNVTGEEEEGKTTMTRKEQSVSFNSINTVGIKIPIGPNETT